MSDEEPKEVEVLEDAKDQLPVPQDYNPKVHPMAKGIRSAKACINEILKDSDNLDKLKMALQTMFDQDPIKFIEKFEPLMDKYDKLKEDQQKDKQTVRLYMRQGDDNESAIEFTRED